MNTTDIIGTTGVAILLLAYFLNLAGKLPQKNYGYIILNIVGAGLACAASILLNFLPFIILEGAWTLVSVIALVTKLMKR